MRDASAYLMSHMLLEQQDRVLRTAAVTTAWPRALETATFSHDDRRLYVVTDTWW